MNPVILVGRRPDRGQRDELWHWCKARWDVLLGWPVAVGYHQPEDRREFCLSVASNRAARAGGDWDVAVYVGADWFAGSAAQVEAAARLALDVGQLVFAHDRTVVLNEQTTGLTLGTSDPAEEWLLPTWPAGGPEEFIYGVVHPNTFSGVLAIPRVLWDAVGGFDERLVGWGFDDLCLWMACDAIGHGFQRVPGAIYHLWHEQDRSLREDASTHGTNMVLWERYREALRSPSRMVALLSEKGGPLA